MKTGPLTPSTSQHSSFLDIQPVFSVFTQKTQAWRMEFLCFRFSMMRKNRGLLDLERPLALESDGTGSECHFYPLADKDIVP